MRSITVEELKAKLDKGEKVNLVDVREPEEHAEFNIGGTLLPLGQIQSMMIGEIEDLKDEDLVLYCRSGSRSAVACHFLDMMGFKQTNNLIGGMMAWKEKFGG
jgi:rhodanese-related sulfurtransferase